MKLLFNLKTLAFILFINSSLMAQNNGFLVDSTRKTLTMGYGTYTSTKNYYYYNNYNQLKFIDTYTNKNSFPDTADWQNTGNTYHYYDDQHRIIKYVKQTRKAWEPDWSYKFKQQYQYSDTTNIKTTYSWDFISGNWNDGNVKYIDTLKAPQELESSRLTQYRNDETGEWKNDYWVDTAFLQPDMIDAVNEIYWMLSDTIIYHGVVQYDYTYYPDTLFTYEFEFGDSSYCLLSKIYYSQDSLTKYNYTYRSVNDTITDTLFRRIYHFDNEQREIKYEKADWFPATQSWSTLLLTTHEYDENGLLIQYDYHNTGTNSRTKYQYNDDDLLWKKIFYNDLNDLTHFSTTYYYYTYTYVNIPEETINNAREIVFYPNPSRSVIHFYGLQNTTKHYRIYDVTGKVVGHGRLFKDENTLDVSELIPGYYVAVVTSGSLTYQGKFMRY